MRTQSRDTHPDAERVQIELLRRRGPGGRFELARSLCRTTCELARQALRRLAPQNEETAIRSRFLELHYGVELAQAFAAACKDFDLQPPEILAALRPVCELLDALGVRHHVGGSVASSIQGIPRSTLGVDLVADLKEAHVRPLVDGLNDAYYVSEPMIREAIRRRSSFNLIHFETSFKVDVFVPQGRPADREALSRAKRLPLGPGPDARPLPVATPEDVVLSKLEWYRLGEEVSERQWTDVLGVLKVQGRTLDFAYLELRAAELGVADLLRRSLQDAGLSAGEEPPTAG